MDFSKKVQLRLLWIAVFGICLLPFLAVVLAAVQQTLGADPAKEIVLELGTWAIILLWASLAVTPLRKLLKWSWLAKYRRMLGLYSFFYASMHLLAFATFMVGWDLDILFLELTQRLYAIAGFAGLLLLIPLALTSTKKMQKRLKQNWLKLHKLVYVVALLSLLHIVWQIRSDYSEALIYGLLLCWMLGYRYYIRTCAAQKRKQSVMVQHDKVGTHQ
jgi:sulfoxide reductase heme-binding subunit YedZ